MNVAQLLERAITSKKRSRNYEESDNGKVVYINPVLISTPAFHPRTSFDTALSLELCASISKYGIIHPITVRLSDDGKYQVVCGARRLRSAKMLGFEKIPCIIVDVDEKEAKALCVEENRCRIPLENDKTTKEKSKSPTPKAPEYNNMKETSAQHSVSIQKPKGQNIKISLKDGRLLLNSVNRLADLAKNCGAVSSVEVFPQGNSNNSEEIHTICLKIVLPDENAVKMP